jgi:outer membrane protein assembly factor BamB
MSWRVFLGPIAVLVLVAPSAFVALAGSELLDPAAPSDDGAAPATADRPAALRQALDVLDEARVPTQEADAPPGVAGLRLLLSDLDRQEPSNQSNATNNETGTQSHHHANVGDEGLGSVWVAAFHGVPSRVALGDIDADGVPDVVSGSEIALTAISGADGSLLWARHIGSPVTGLLLLDVNGDSRLDVAFSTGWGGQTPRVGALRGATGDVLWEFVGRMSSFLGLRATGSGPNADILTVATNGTHYRLAAADGRVVWKTPVDLLPTTGALVAGYYNFGQYLYEAVDLTGDGVADPVSASLQYYYGGFLVGVFQQFTIVHALDGATGQRLWIHPVGGDPSTFGFHMLYDLEGLDARGDRSLDLAFAGMSIRYYSVPFAATVPTAEAFVRVLDGSSNTVGVPLGDVSSVGPGFTLERYLELERTDMDGDHRDELYVLSSVVLDQVLNGFSFTLKRYALPPSATSHPTMLLLSDTGVGLKGALSTRLSSIDPEGDGKRDALLLQRTKEASTIQRVTDISVATTTIVPGETVRAVGVMGDRAGVATNLAVEVRSFPDLGQVRSRFDQRGTPRGLLTHDHDGDSYPDLFVKSTDGNVHVVDGLTGRMLETLDWTDTTDAFSGVRDLRIVRFEGDAVDDYIIVRSNGSAEAWDGASHQARWKARALSDGSGVVWFDANGDAFPDLLSSYNYVDRTLTATNGRTGQTLWTADMPESDSPLFFLDRYVPARLSTPNTEDIVVFDNGNLLFAIGGSSGKLLWNEKLETYYTGVCFGAVDHEGDGTDLFYFAGRDKRMTLRSYGRDGRIEEVPVLEEKATGVICRLDAAPRGDKPGEDLLASFAYALPMTSSPTAFMSGFGRYAGHSWVWQDIQASPPEEYGALRLLGIDASGPDGGRFYYGWQDHVFARRWTDAGFLGEFTINGPFVVDGTVLDLDRSTPAEAITVTSDGLLWALADDPQKVLSALDDEAVRLGKEPPSGASADEVREKSKPHRWIPGPEPWLVLAALAGALVALRRR